MTPLIGIAVIILAALSFSMCDDRVLRRLNLCGIALWAVYYGALGAWPAVATLILGACIILSARFGMPRVSLALIGVNVLLIPVSAISGGLTETLPPAGSSILNFGVVMTSGATLTAALLAGQVVWLSYAAQSGVSVAVINGLICIAAIGIRCLPSCRPLISEKVSP